MGSLGTTEVWLVSGGGSLVGTESVSLWSLTDSRWLVPELRPPIPDGVRIEVVGLANFE